MGSDAFAAAGYGANEVGFGRKPAVLVVDFQLAFTDGVSPMGRSPHVDAAVARASEALERVRELGVPVLHTVVAYRRPEDVGYWKVADLAELRPGSTGCEVDPRVLAEGDVVIEKRFPSAFFGTDAASILRFWDVDTVVIAGCVTSGCIRATTIDAFSHGFRTIVAQDCCGDHDPVAHEQNLRDVGRRYADVLDSSAVLTALRR